MTQHLNNIVSVADVAEKKINFKEVFCGRHKYSINDWAVM